MSFFSIKPELSISQYGVALIIEEDHNLPLVTVQVACNIGELQKGEDGLAHLLERILLQQLQQHRAIKKKAQGGISYWQFESSTKAHQTFYYVNVSPTEAVDAIAMLANIVRGSYFSVEEYKKAQDEINQEDTLEAKNPDFVSWKFFQQAFFNRKPLPKPLSSHSGLINNLSYEDVMTYYKEHYVPSKLCFIVIGDVNAEKIKAQIESLFPQSSPPLSKTFFPSEEALPLEKCIQRNIFPLELSRLNMAWRGPSLRSPDAPAMEIIAALLKQENSEKKELFQKFFSILNSTHQGKGYLLVKALVEPGKRAVAERELLKQVASLKMKKVTTTEIEKSKELLLLSYENAIQVVGKRAFSYSSSWFGTGDPCFQQKYLRAIESVTSAEVKRVAQQYLVDEVLTITSLDPTAA